MTLKVYNSLTQQKEEFVPLIPKKVSMYVCGVTVYDSCHLGHARAAVSFDIVYRYLKHLDYDVTYVRNFTDVDDKIIHRSNERKIPWQQLTEQYIAEYHRDMKSLNVLTPTLEPKATEHIAGMIKMIEGLITNGKAYAVNGDVYYAVRQFAEYGKLSHKNIEDLAVGARIDINEQKKDPLDFALWKKAKPGEPSWESPWGQGRPGWHIECSVMSTQHLGDTFDIHGGGRDLIFPHHENEIAQAEGYTHKPFSRYFLHNGFVNINAEKMSKSLGNFTTIRQVVDSQDWEVVRYFLIAAHYGSPIDYTEKNIQEAKSALDRFYELGLRLSKIQNPSADWPATLNAEQQELKSLFGELPVRIREAMNEDFNTPQALAAVFEVVRLTNKYLDQNSAADSFQQGLAHAFKNAQILLNLVLGVFASDPQEYFERFKQNKVQNLDVDTPWIEQKIQDRREARQSKDFKRGDQIRDELAAKGIVLKDRPDGTTEWFFQ